MPLSDVVIRNATPREKPFKMGDSLGLFLLVQPSGGKLWRLKYRINGREKKFALGVYPDVSLSDARRRRDEARRLLADGKDPSLEKQREKTRSRIEANNTFGAIAEEYCRKRRRDGEKAWATSTATRSEYLLSQLAISIGRVPVAAIGPAAVLAAVRNMEDHGNLESARRPLQLPSTVFRYTVPTRSRIEANNTFGAIAEEYCRKRRRDGEKAWATSTATRSEYLLSQLAISIGRVPVAEIGPADVLAAVRKMEDKGNLESARRTLQLASSVFRYAVATVRLNSDPTRDLRGALISPKVTHYGAITDPAKAGELLVAIDGSDGHGVTKLALQI